MAFENNEFQETLRSVGPEFGFDTTSTFAPSSLSAYADLAAAASDPDEDEDEDEEDEEEEKAE